MHKRKSDKTEAAFMIYENASDILPDHLLQELKQYAAGKLLYVPFDKERKSWGEVSGYRHFLTKRNQMIMNMFIHGKTIKGVLKNCYFYQMN
jgi:hypothetical protein